MSYIVLLIQMDLNFKGIYILLALYENIFSSDEERLIFFNFFLKNYEHRFCRINKYNIDSA